MTIDKYRNVEDMPAGPRPIEEVDLARRIRLVWARSRLLASVGYIPGVQKFTSIEAASAARQRSLRQRARALEQQRHE